MAKNNIRSKLVLKDLGNPDMIKSEPANVNRLVLGTLVGEATGFLERTNPKDGTVMEGLIGSFRSIPAQVDGDIIESGVLYIPDAFHNLIAGALRDQLKKDSASKVGFAFEVASIRANNPQGRSWDFRPLIDNAAYNPVDALISDIGEVKVIDGKRVLHIAVDTPKAIEHDKAKAKK